jgi:hypothetical protein
MTQYARCVLYVIIVTLKLVRDFRVLHVNIYDCVIIIFDSPVILDGQITSRFYNVRNVEIKVKS